MKWSVGVEIEITFLAFKNNDDILFDKLGSMPPQMMFIKYRMVCLAMDPS